MNDLPIIELTADEINQANVNRQIGRRQTVKLLTKRQIYNLAVHRAINNTITDKYPVGTVRHVMGVAMMVLRVEFSGSEAIGAKQHKQVTLIGRAANDGLRELTIEYGLALQLLGYNTPKYLLFTEEDY